MKIELIPAIDIINGQCVRLTKGDYRQKTVYADDPVSVARHFEAMGFSRLHIVDLDGAKARHIVNTQTLRDITAQTRLTVDFGGGVKTDDDLRTAFESGANMVTVGSIAVTQPDLMENWIATYGANRFVLGADVRNRHLSINGWMEDSQQEIISFLRHYYALGIRKVLCTDIDRDGMLSGPSIDLYRDILNHFPDLHLIASGGVSCVGDILRLQSAGIPAVVFGKAIYENRIQMENGKLKSGDDEIIIK